MRKPLIAFGLIALIFLAQMIVTAPVTGGKRSKLSLRAQLNPNYVRAMAAYKRLEPKLTRDELRAITTIGILNGAKEVEEKMEQHLIEVVKDLVENTDVNDRKVIVPKIEKIEGQVTRDQQALEILTCAMDLAMGKISAKEFRKEMQQTLQEIKRNKENKENLEVNQVNQPKDEVKGEGEELSLDEAAYLDFIGNKISNLRQHILHEMDIMKNMVAKKIENTLEHIIDEADENGLIAQASERVIQKRAVESKTVIQQHEVPAEVRMINSILSESDFRDNLIENGLEKRNDAVDDAFDKFELNELNKNAANRSSNNKNSTKNRKNNDIIANNNQINKNLNNNIRDVIRAVVGNVNANRTKISANNSSNRPAKQEVLASQDGPENDDDDFGDNGGGEGGGGDGGDGAGGGGGLVGIITSLSGGEGGSDVGALIGALTGVISTLFGPGGLDIESLIGTGTSLISGLLSGNKNFGTVLGNYVGTALDGLSGGGGAINNGQFIGNFLGTVVASLSADPEGEDGQLKPLLFAENLLNSFLEAKNRKDSEEEGSEERKGDGGGGGGHNHKPPKKEEHGSDSGAFVKGIVSKIVGEAIAVILNASLGVVSGASSASHKLFASSSHNHGWQ